MRTKLQIIVVFVLNIFFGGNNILFAQMMAMPRFIDEFETLDSSRAVITYSLEFINDSSKLDNIDTDVIILEIGSKISKSYSYGLYKHDSIATNNKRSSGVPLLQIAVPPIEVFKNYPIGSNTVIHRSPLSGPIFLYEENDLKIDWTILPERKNLLGFECQKATANFRGRAWEAWFTNQIPIPDGPWKFQGLPGLILEVADSHNHFKFTCIGLSKDKVPMKKWKWNYEKTTRVQVNNLLIRYAERPYVVGPQIGIVFGFIGGSQKDKSTPYNPLELE